MVGAYDDFLVHYLAMHAFIYVYIALFDCDDFYMTAETSLRTWGSPTHFKFPKRGLT